MRIAPFALCLVLASTACSPMRPPCSTATCSGCCTADQQCLGGTTPMACGRGGNLCRTCLVTETCLATTGSCINSLQTGGGAAFGGGSAGGGAGGAMGGGTTNPNEVVGSCTESWLSERDAGTRFCVLTNETLPTAVYFLPDGGLTNSQASVFADGTFVFTNVPMGPWLLKTGTTWYRTAERSLTLDFHSVGRVDGVLAGSGTTLTVNATNLTPWNPQTMFLSLASANAGIDLSGFSLGQMPAPAQGATAFDFSIPWSAWSQQRGTPMLDSTRGDVATITQVAFASTGEYRIVGAGAATPVQMVSGQQNTVTARLTAPPISMLPLDVDTAAFGAYLQDFTPGLAPTLSVSISVGPRPVHAFDRDGLVFVWGSFPIAGNPPVTLPNPIPFPNPYPGTWGATVTLQYAQTVSRQHPSATEPRGFISGISLSAAAQALASPVVPVVSPPRSVQLGGVPFSMDQTGLSRTPTLTWAPPSLGTPSRYLLHLDQLQVSTGRTTARRVATFWLLPTDTAFTLPPNLLSQGQSYVFTFAAFTTPTNLLKDFADIRLPSSTAQVVSGVLRP